MLASTYDEALARVLAHEGGYSNHPSDPGGATKYGITIHDARRYWKSNASAADVSALPINVAKEIYRTRYAEPLRFHELPAGVDYAVLDYGIHSGIVRSAKVLQRVVGVEADGKIGAGTLACVRARDPKVVAAAICDERLAFLKSLPTWPSFGRGWARRVAEVRAAALTMAGRPQGVSPIIIPPPPGEGGSRSEPGGVPPWLARMNAILGLYEFPGSADNPAIVGMAKACGGSIAKIYRHDATPWCALTINYCLVASGLPGNDSLWALDFARYGQKLSGPAPGAIAIKKRQGGGHVFLIVGRTASGRLVGRGGNQADMVCDQEFEPGEIIAYRWPAKCALPAVTGMARLPVVEPAKRERRALALPPPSQTAVPGKGVVPAPKAVKEIAIGVPAAGAGAGLTFWQWIIEHPLATAGLVAVAAIMIGATIHALRRRHRARQEAPTAGLVPVVTAQQPNQPAGVRP